MCNALTTLSGSREGFCSMSWSPSGCFCSFMSSYGHWNVSEILSLVWVLSFSFSTEHTGRKRDQENTPNVLLQLRMGVGGRMGRGGVGGDGWRCRDKTTWVHILPPPLTCHLSVPSVSSSVPPLELIMRSPPG